MTNGKFKAASSWGKNLADAAVTADDGVLADDIDLLAFFEFSNLRFDQPVLIIDNKQYIRAAAGQLEV